MSLTNSYAFRRPVQGVVVNLALLASLGLLFYGLQAPILTLEKFYFFSNTVSLLSALRQLAVEAEWGLFALVGLMGTLGQLCMTRGYAIAKAAAISPFTYASVLFGAAYGYLFWDESLSLQFIVGALLIAAAGILALRFRERPETLLVSDPV